MTDSDSEAVRERYRRRADAFEARISAVDEDRWGWQSPCDDWDARDVVGHIVMMHGAMLTPLGRSLSPAPAVSEDPLAAFRAARADVESLLANPETAAAQVSTPMGPSSYGAHVDQVVSEDMVLHGWDLARATGQDDTIDPVELDRIWPGVKDIPDIMRQPEAFGPGIVVFGPIVEVSEDAPIQDQALGYLGRDPSFVPGPRSATA